MLLPLLPLLRYVAFDPETGVVLPGAKLFTYEAGGSVAKATYQDAEGDTPHANPIIADANGLFAQIFVSPEAYRFVLKDADNVEIYEADDVISSGGARTIASTAVAHTVDPDEDTILVTGGGPFTITLHTAAGHTGKRLTIKSLVSALITIDPNGSETIDGLASWGLNSKYQSIELESDGTNWQIVNRDGHAVTSYTALATIAAWEGLILAAGTFTLTLPAAASLKGRRLTFKTTAAGTVTLDGNGAETIDGAATNASMNTQYAKLTIESDGSNWHVVA